MDSSALSTMTLGEIVDPSRRVLGDMEVDGDGVNVIAIGIIFLLRLLFEFFVDVCFDEGKKGGGMSLGGKGGKKGARRELAVEPQRRLTDDLFPTDDALGEFAVNFPFEDQDIVVGFVCFLFSVLVIELYDVCDNLVCNRVIGPIVTIPLPSPTSNPAQACALNCMGAGMGIGQMFTGSQVVFPPPPAPQTPFCECVGGCEEFAAPDPTDTEQFFVTFLALPGCGTIVDLVEDSAAVEGAAAAPPALPAPSSWAEYTDGIMAAVAEREARR